MKTYFARIPGVFALALYWSIIPALHAQNGVPGYTNTTVVTIAATDASASEAGLDTGRFTVSRHGPTNDLLLVSLAIGGTASNGVDYQLIQNSLTIPAGAFYATITITPIDDSLIENDEMVVLHVVPSPLANAGSDYRVGTPSEAVVVIRDNDRPPENHPPTVRIVSPTNGTSFTPPAEITIFADAQDSDGMVQSVEFFAGYTSLGIVTNNPLVLSPANPWHLTWTNVPAGAYSLSARATDDKGARASSEHINVYVRPVNTQPVVTIVATDPEATEIPVVPPGQGRPQMVDPAVFTVSRTGDTSIPLTVYYGTGGSAHNGVDYDRLSGSVTIPVGSSSATIEVFPIDDLLVEGTETVEIAVQPPVCIAIYPPPPDCYLVGTPGHATAYIRDNDVGQPDTNRLPVVRITAPLEHSTFRAPANILIQASAYDADGVVNSVEFFEGTNRLGRTDLPSTIAGEHNFSLLYTFPWSNIVAGEYILTARATDDDGAAAISQPVRISVVVTNPPPPPTNELPRVTIHASDAAAIEGLPFLPTNGVAPNGPIVNTNHFTNTATFVVRRSGPTISSLTVYYSIGGTASNGADYVLLPGSVTIPAGEMSARIVAEPIDDALPEPVETVVLRLRQPAGDGPTLYQMGWPNSAAAYILDNDAPSPHTCRFADGLFHVCLPGTNGWPYRMEYSTNLVNWVPVCTNVVVDGGVHFVDPEAGNGVPRFYRAIPEANPPAE